MNKQWKSTRNPFHAVVQGSKPQLDARPYGGPPSLLLSQLSHLPTFSCSSHPSLLSCIPSSHSSFFLLTAFYLFVLVLHAVGPRHIVPTVAQCSACCVLFCFSLFLCNWHYLLCIKPPPNYCFVCLFSSAFQRCTSLQCLRGRPWEHRLDASLSRTWTWGRTQTWASWLKREATCLKSALMPSRRGLLCPSRRYSIE